MHTLLYGGTFDPVHHGHLILARAAREALHADTVLFMPARISPLKSDPGAPSEDRLHMLRLAIQNEPAFQIDDRELRRPGKSFTFDTLHQLQSENPSTRYTLLLGQDQLPKFHAWHRVHEILAIADIALMARPGENLEAGLAAVHTHLGTHTADRLRQALLTTPLIEIAATDIRARVQRGLSISYLVPDAVAAFIAQKPLYR